MTTGQRYIGECSTEKIELEADLSGGEFLLVFLPLAPDAVSWFRAVASFLFCSLVRVIFVYGLLGIEEPEPFSILFEGGREIKGVRIRGCAS